MTTVSRPRLVLLGGLVLLLMLVSTGWAQALWSASTTHTTTTAAGRIAVAMDGPGLSAANISTSTWSAPTTVTVTNTGAVDINVALAFTTAGTLAAHRVDLALWERSGNSCPTTITTPPTGSVTSTLTAPVLPAGMETIRWNKPLVLCAATRINGDLFGTAGQSLTATPVTTATYATSNWKTTATGKAFTHTIAPAPTPVTSIACRAVTAGTVELSWPTVHGATNYRVTAFNTTQEVTTGLAKLTAPEAKYTTGQQSVDITARGPTGASAPVNVKVRMDGTSPCL